MKLKSLRAKMETCAASETTAEAKNDWTRMETAFMLPSDLSLSSRIQVANDPAALRVQRGVDSMAFCVIVPGRTLPTLEEETADSGLLMSNDDGYVLRDANQVLPLFEFGHKDLEQVCSIRNSVVERVNQILLKLSPIVDPSNNKSLEYNPKRVQVWDVMCDRYDKRCVDHFGNRRLAILICMFMTKDQNLLNVAVRIRVARAIIHTIQNGDQGGRFLARTNRNTWKEVNDVLAIKWLSLILKIAERSRDTTVQTNPKDPKVIAHCVKISMKSDKPPPQGLIPGTGNSPELIAVE
eukprot:CAMPEP_0116542862 /NCGR_PEP_ID=MMETSP0397-20121206/1242_1 /TAXON_ID=216820 /ORGANISM="Cyclophora tenuis, Strain ECT3854" /LENGTH=294 /DNA_ID=CAMNT_0004066899 /DNA_START=144 /DNA_END=1028 /DNA_ORIENTATION=-